MTRVLHTGDTHIGYRQYHSPERRADFLAAFRRVVDDAIADDVDAVVHAGDLFHDRRPALADIHGTIEVLRTLRDADIPVFAVVGNHERTRGQQWLDLFETLGLAIRLGREPHVVGDVALYGLDFVPRSQRGALAYDFAPHEADHAALVAHGLFEPFAHADWETETLLQAASVDFDVMLLGDNHAPGVETVADTWVTYCGSTERVDASERDDRGYNLVSFDGDVTIARRGIETRPFVAVDLELAPGEGLGRVRDRLREEPLSDAVVVVTITGDGDAVSPADVETFAADRGALVARVTDRREFESVDVDTVRFADPDRAVEARLEERGLSAAALAIDATIRDADVARANVRDDVTATVRELLDDEPETFEPAAQASPEPVEAAQAGGADPDATPDAESSTDDAGVDDSPERVPAAAPAGEGGGAATKPADESPVRTEGQVTMEDYL